MSDASERQTAAAKGQAVVVFRAAGMELGIRAGVVKAVLERVPVCRVPRRNGALLGLVAYAGEVLPCCSAARLLGLAGKEEVGRVVVLEERVGARWAVMVDAVLGVPSVQAAADAGERAAWSDGFVVGEQGETIAMVRTESLFAKLLQAAG